MKTPKYSMNSFGETDFKYPIFRNVLFAFAMLFALAMVLTPIIFVINEVIEAYNIGFSMYIIDLVDVVKSVMLRFVTEAHPLFVLCAFFMLFFLIGGCKSMLSDMSVVLFEPIAFIFADDGLVCRTFFGSRIIAYENIFHIDESTINVTINYRKGKKIKELKIIDMLKNYDQFVTRIKKTLVGVNGYYYNSEYINGKQNKAKSSVIKGLIAVLAFQSFFFLFLISVRLQKGLELDMLTMFVAVIFFFGIFFYIVWQSMQTKKFKYRDGTLHVEYIFFRKRSYDIKLEEIDSAKTKNRVYLIVSYRKNISKKRLTLNNVPSDGIDLLFEDLKKRGLVTE